ncbi:MAG: hypothetical protein BroJett030_28280 [Alphaproteobacteria bacterium]|nr:MAG: hypothetical protein BroJett030_28280 [Alphaproteobacteria bacterium]
MASASLLGTGFPRRSLPAGAGAHGRLPFPRTGRLITRNRDVSCEAPGMDDRLPASAVSPAARREGGRLARRFDRTDNPPFIASPGASVAFAFAPSARPRAIRFRKLRQPIAG